MAGRKPIPKTQKELSELAVSGTGSAGSRGNGNIDESQRGTKKSFKGDTTKPLTIGLEDLDQSILYYFQNVIQPQVEQNGEIINVPTIYGNPERWKAVQHDGYYRDKKGKVMSPLIMFKRNNLERKRNITSKIDATNPHNYIVFTQGFSRKNVYDNFSTLTNREPDKKLYSTIVPEYVTLSYSCVMITYYHSQMNKLQESITFAADSYWGDPERFKFMANIDSFSNIVEYENGSHRTIKSEFDIRLHGYIIPDVLIKDLNTKNQFSHTSQVFFGIETTHNSI